MPTKPTQNTDILSSESPTPTNAAQVDERGRASENTIGVPDTAGH